MMPAPKVSKQAASSLSAKADRSGVPSSWPRLRSAPDQAKMVALIANAKGFVDTAAYWENVELLKETIHELLEVMYGSWQ